jgi:membrane dipeptidase
MPHSVSRRTVLAAGALTALPLSAALRAFAAPASATALYRRAIVIDGLGGPGDSDAEPGTPLSDAAIGDSKASGLTCVNVTLGPVGTTPPDTAFRQLLKDIATAEHEIDRSPKVFARVRNVVDIETAKRNGQVGLVYGVQDAVAFETDLSLLETLHQFGLRVVQPTYNRRNLLGDGCLEPANSGLSRAGAEAIEKLNSLGILVDLSHCGRQTTADAIRLSKRPVAFTHTGCDAVANHPRNRTDAELRAVADGGGVSGIYFMPYLCDGKQPTAADVLRHMEHAIQVAGEDHVSIGTDGNISAIELTPEFIALFAKDSKSRKDAGIAAPGETETGYLFASDLNTPRRLELLAQMLLDRGHSSTRVEKILGANLLRVFGASWA